MFVDEDVEPSIHLLGFTEENELLKQEDVTLTFPPPGPDSELILADQLTLLLQVHLEEGEKEYGREEEEGKEGGKEIVGKEKGKKGGRRKEGRGGSVCDELYLFRSTLINLHHSLGWRPLPGGRCRGEAGT